MRSIIRAYIYTILGGTLIRLTVKRKPPGSRLAGGHGSYFITVWACPGLVES
jgi:hypothetical protein